MKKYIGFQKILKGRVFQEKMPLVRLYLARVGVRPEELEGLAPGDNDLST